MDGQVDSCPSDDEEQVGGDEVDHNIERTFSILCDTDFFDNHSIWHLTPEEFADTWIDMGRFDVVEQPNPTLHAALGMIDLR